MATDTISTSNIETLNTINDKLKTYWVEQPLLTIDNPIRPDSPALNALLIIENNIVDILRPSSKYSSELSVMLQALLVTAGTINTFIYPKLTSATKTNTIFDEMSLTNLKIYASFMGLTSNVAGKLQATVTLQVKELTVLQSWLNAFIKS